MQTKLELVKPKIHPKGKKVKEKKTLNCEGPFSFQKFSPKNFHLPFKHMYEALNMFK